MGDYKRVKQKYQRNTRDQTMKKLIQMNESDVLTTLT